MTNVDSTPLHALLGGRVRWTNSLWEESHRYLREVVTDEGALELERILFCGDGPLRTTEERFEEFRRRPPTVLLGAFDQIRWHQAVDEMVTEAIDKSAAEGAAREWRARRTGQG